MNPESRREFEEGLQEIKRKYEQEAAEVKSKYDQGYERQLKMANNMSEVTSALENE